ncbi:hypothetical protein D5S17_33510 [Pseudonocardiaceae bacterium YIM PH 21723]|nr:hypothetical protein D5S17_33510 [Pseudonocardiaceae bacterium YIM PH 21723]
MSDKKKDVRAEAGEVMRGLELQPLPEGWTPLEALTVIKCLDAEGEARWCTRWTTGINSEELLGVMVFQTELLKHDMLADWDEEDDDEDDD